MRNGHTSDSENFVKRSPRACGAPQRLETPVSEPAVTVGTETTVPSDAKGLDVRANCRSDPFFFGFYHVFIGGLLRPRGRPKRRGEQRLVADCDTAGRAAVTTTQNYLPFGDTSLDSTRKRVSKPATCVWPVQVGEALVATAIATCV